MNPLTLAVAVESDTETQIPINVAALLILANEARRIVTNIATELLRPIRNMRRCSLLAQSGHFAA
jgi:hypothetical protein